MTGVERIAEERRRQIEREGYSAEHDDGHTGGQLAAAACAYLMPDIQEHVDFYWPFEPEAWKPGESPIYNLAKAGALIAAEIDRLERAP